MRQGLADLPAAVQGTRPIAIQAIATEVRAVSGRLTARAARYDRLPAEEMERIAWQVIAVRTAVGRMAGPGG